MKASLAMLLATIVLAVSGCTSAFTGKSAQHATLPAGSRGTETSWVPGEDDIRNLEQKLGHMFYAADPRVAGLPDNVPPYPLNEYYIRYTGTGPADNRFILGEAIHKSLADAEKFLTTPTMGFPPKGGPRFFSVMYDMQSERIMAVRFNQN